MNNTQLLNDINKQLEQLLDSPEARISDHAGQVIEQMQEKIYNNLSPDKKPDIPQIVMLIDGGIIQQIEANRGDIEITVIDKDLEAEEQYHIQQKPVDEVMFDKSYAIRKFTGK